MAGRRTAKFHKRSEGGGKAKAPQRPTAARLRELEQCCRRHEEHAGIDAQTIADLSEAIAKTGVQLAEQATKIFTQRAEITGMRQSLLNERVIAAQAIDDSAAEKSAHHHTTTELAGARETIERLTADTAILRGEIAESRAIESRRFDDIVRHEATIVRLAGLVAGQAVELAGHDETAAIDAARQRANPPSTLG